MKQWRLARVWTSQERDRTGDTCCCSHQLLSDLSRCSRAAELRCLRLGRGCRCRSSAGRRRASSRSARGSRSRGYRAGNGRGGGSRIGNGAGGRLTLALLTSTGTAAGRCARRRRHANLTVRGLRSRGAATEDVDVDGRALRGPAAVVDVVEVAALARVPDDRVAEREGAVAAGGEAGGVDGASLGRLVELEPERYYYLGM